MRRLNVIFASFVYTGFFPFAPATFATAVFLALYWLVPGGAWMAHWAVLVVTAVLSVPAATAMERRYGNDPHCVVIDEVVGIQIALVGAAPTLPGVLAAFVLFRVFDVWKPFPIFRLQSLPGGWGVVADDALAGVYTRVVLILAATYLPAIGQFIPHF
ncbi:MAG TPA: phosphatidylglycerophosphatase A [Candidatus Krumholzibacteria bacterium]|nr:phosphatidylglycerophosphatase A [Candidatus Krumholzibacteria bacterium]